MNFDYAKAGFIVALVAAALAFVGAALLPHNAKLATRWVAGICFVGVLLYLVLPGSAPQDTTGQGTTQTTRSDTPTFSPSLSSSVPTVDAPTTAPPVIDSPADGWNEPQGGSGRPAGGSDGGGSGDTANTNPAPAPAPGIMRVDISFRGGGALTLVDPNTNTYKLPSYTRTIPPPSISFHWDSRSRAGTLSGACAVTIEVQGPPPDYPQNQLSGECSGSPDQRFNVYNAGTYTVLVTVTPPEGGSPTTGQATFTLVSS